MRGKYIIYIFCTIFATFFCLSSCTKEKEIKPVRYNGNYSKDFNDINDLHLASALKIGIKPLANREEAEKMKSKLTEVKTRKDYIVEELTHSIPFLVPKAVDLLDKIAENFADSLSSLNAPHYKLIVTSVTRTQDDVRRLGRNNTNASKNSAHTYGTTLDISWKRFAKDDRSSKELSEEKLKMVLATVLRDLKKEGACYVKHEKQQACFHITVR
jgi:uncharacterized protein YcbK (DUF882 family)